MSIDIDFNVNAIAIIGVKHSNTAYDCTGVQVLLHYHSRTKLANTKGYDLNVTATYADFGLRTVVVGSSDGRIDLGFEQIMA